MLQTPEATDPQPDSAAGIGRKPTVWEEPIQPFRLVKYFSLTGFIVILVFTLVLSLVISQQAKTMLLKKSNDYAILLADNLNHQVFLQFVLPTAIRYGRIRLRDPIQQERLDTVVRNTIHSFKVERVNIYDVEGTITYSTDETLIGSTNTDQAAYEAALQGKSSSTLVTTPGSGLAGFERTRALRTFYPFRGERQLEGAVGNVLGVFEIYQDLSQDYDEIAKFQYLSIGISLIFMGVLFVILRKILVRADQIIEERNEERRRLEERLHHSMRLANLGQMIAAVAHEIRNPLGIISSTAELLENRIKKYEPNNRLPDVIVEEAQRLNGIVTEFLDFARPQVPHPGPCRLADILEKNIVFLTPTLEKSGIEVERDYQGPEEIEADSDLLYRAFLNVFMNAIQAMPEGGRIRIRTSLLRGPDGQASNKAEIVIVDSGEGIDPETAQTAFIPFFTTKNRGSGLGLAIVKNIVDEHKGEVTIGPGEDAGTRVVILLPLKQE